MGEGIVTGAVALLAARGAAGWPVDAVTAAGEGAGEELELLTQPYAPGVLEGHRREGRLLVLATTSPAALVAPYARRLGFDAVIATHWTTEDGRFTGAVDGTIVWGRGKLEAVRAWATEAGVDLSASWAYSDSYYDGPLLDAVGHATADNPDVRLAGLARLKGWPVRYLDLPEGVLKVAGRELQAWGRPLARPELLLNIELDVEGIDNVPRSGPLIAVFNHRSYLDATVVAAVLGRTKRPFRFLGKKEVFDMPVVGALGRLAGGIRVDRASGSDEPLEHAISALRAGDAVALAPQGTIPRGPAFFDPVLKGRWGAARLARATHAPVIPIGLWGTEVVWPRNRRLPRLDSRPRETIRVRVGGPVDLKYSSLDADTRRIMAAIVDQLPDEARLRHTPTEDEIAATYPAGYRGDPGRESARRPGTDT